VLGSQICLENMSAPETKQKIYYLPGYGGALNSGLGEELENRGFSVSGRATVGEFAALDFADQIEIVRQDLINEFWSTDSKVIANSFGAYLFLHAQAQIPPHVGKVLLLSPIVGDFVRDDGLRIFSPPRAGKLQSLARSCTYPAPANCEIHVGSEDWQSDPVRVAELAKLLNVAVHIVDGDGHMLDKTYVNILLDNWL
jgi:hypothetical protein